MRIELELLLRRREEQQAAEIAVRERFEEGRLQLDALRDQLREVRVQAEARRKDVSRLQLRHRELSVDAEHMSESVQERSRVDLNEHQVPEATEAELERQQRQLKQLQQRIESLGEVNLMAIEEHREHEERYEFLTKREGMGLGDVKLLAMLCAFLGLRAVFPVIFIGSVLGTLVGVPLMLLKKSDGKLAIPFGPFLACGALVYVFFIQFWDPLMRWYGVALLDLWRSFFG